MAEDINVPDWVQNKDAYIASTMSGKKYKPVTADLIAKGVDSNTASSLLYGVVGSNTDTRDWDAIMESDDIAAAARQATGEMYSNPAATANNMATAYSDFERSQVQGNNLKIGGGYEGPKIVEIADPTGMRDKLYAIVSHDGLALRAGYNTLEAAQKDGIDFGISSDAKVSSNSVNNNSSNNTSSVSSSTSASSNSSVNIGQGEASDIQKLADLVFLSQNTGVSSALLDEAKKAVGIDITDPFSFEDANKLLYENGYFPGTNGTFYGDNAIFDTGAQILYERWQNAPTDDDLIAAGLNPDDYVVVNNNVANQTYLQNILNQQGGSSNASFSNLAEGQTIEQNRLDFDKNLIGKDNSFWNKFESPSSAALDMLEWDLIKQQVIGTDTTNNTATTGITGTDTSTSGGQISGGFTANPNTLNIADSAVLPTFTNGVSQVSDGATGTYTVPAQTFEQNITDQVSDLQNRAAQQNFTTPQTVAEKQAAGEDVSSYVISQKLFRNPNTGHQLFIPFQGNQALQMIPAGYYEVNQQTGTMGVGVFNPVTAGGNTTTGVNSGGYIQGFNNASIPNPNPIDPSQIYGNVSFQDPTTGEIVTQGPSEYLQSLANKQAQATFNPSTAVTMSGVSTMSELGYEYNEDGTIKLDPVTGQPIVKELMPGTVLESTAGQAQPLAPVIGKRQATDAAGNLLFDSSGQPIMVGADPAQVGTVVQAKGPGTPAIYDEQGNLLSAAIDTPGAATAGVITGAPGVATQLQGGTTTNYAAMAAAVPGAIWDVTTGTFKVGDQTFTPDQFIATNNLNIGNYLTTTGGLEAAKSTGPTKTITGQTDYTTDVGTLTAETGSAQTVADVAGEAGVPVRTLDTTEGASELITGTGVDQGKVGDVFGTGEVQAASVQSELANLMAQFDDGQTPAWAAGAMRKATATMAARGLGASSMAGQAVIQAAMESALPIAQMDASNKQQMALFKAEQRAKFLGMEFDQAFQAKVMNAARVSEIANINFNAEQQIALENSRAANTMDLQNLSNKQALIMAEAAALSQLEMASLNNLQQAQVQNAQNFLQIDMANLSNSQATALFKAQQITNAMLSDTAQANATAQFNATSQNQTNQFFSNLSAQVSQFNAAQQNAINQFNAEEANAILEFNSALQNQREMFNAQNYLAVAQANAQWRQNINTANTEAQNVANLTYAKEVNGLTQKALDDYWQKERDIMSYAFAQSEGAADRALKILLGEMNMESIRQQLEFKENEAKSEFWSDLLFGDASFSDIFKMG